MATACHHQLEGLCKACSEQTPFYQFRLCKKKCLACNECGYFYGTGAPEHLRGKPVVFSTHSPSGPTTKRALYTAQNVRESLKPKWETYYAKLATGQSSNWKCDQRTAELFCLSQWLMDELTASKSSDEDRVDTQDFFNRKARAEDDLYEVAARAMNNCLDGKIDRFRRKYRVH